MRGPAGGGAGWVFRIRPRAGGCGGSGAALRSWGWGSRHWLSSWAGRRSPRLGQPGRFALAAIGAAFGAAAALPGWLAVGVWRFASSVSGGRLIAASKSSPYLIVGKRRFMPPVPP